MNSFHPFAGRRVTVLGAGKTGRAVARFLAPQKAHVFVSDRAELPPLLKEEFSKLGIEYEQGGHSERALQADLIIPSPGVPASSPALVEAHRRGIPIWGELELAYRLCPSEKIIAVTGTVGKTTTTHLIAELLKARGYPVVVAGNIGEPFISQLPKIRTKTIVVLEVSSYQLEQVELFRPHIGVFTRFAPHHLDRHGSLERYFSTKCRLFAQQSESDFAVVHRDIELPRWVQARVFRFSADELQELELPTHQRENLAAALRAACWIDAQITLKHLDLKRALQLPHRLEFVAEMDGVRFYNDSKATSTAATLAAISSFKEPLVLILGGYDDGEDLSRLAQAIGHSDVRAVFLWGQTQERFSKVFRALGYPRFQIVQSVHEAIEKALRLRPKICLFSPAAPSFDRFKDYEERGQYFKHVVRSYLPKTAITPSSDQLAQAP